MPIFFFNSHFSFYLVSPIKVLVCFLFYLYTGHLALFTSRSEVVSQEKKKQISHVFSQISFIKHNICVTIVYYDT